MINFYNGTDGFIKCSSINEGKIVIVSTPDDDDVRFITHTLGVPHQFLQYLADNDERPRVERDHGWMMTILRVPTRDTQSQFPFDTIPVGLITGKDFLIALCFRRTEMLEEFPRRARERKIRISRDSEFVLRMVYACAEWYLIFLKNLYDDQQNAVKQLRKSVRNEDLVAMMNVQKSLVYFNTSLRGDEMLIERLRNIFGPDIDEDLLEDVEIELRQALETTTVYSDILSGTMDTFASIISNNVNQVMKRMTSLSIALMIPTLIASFYGMNVNISLSSNPAAFWIIIAVAVILTTIVIIWFRSIKWF